jgi:hypothetical protein
VSVHRRGARWQVEQALGRFNEPLPPELDELIAQWAHGLRVPGTSAHRRRTPAPPGRPRPAHGPRGRRAPAREALLRASGDLGEAIGDLNTDPRVGWTLRSVRPIAVELGWSGGGTDWLSPFVTVARLRRPGALAGATAGALDAGLRVADLWEATAGRPLTEGVERLGAHDPDLRRLADWAVPPSLRLGLRDPRASAARAEELAARRIRVAVFDLLTSADPRLDRAVAGGPHTDLVATAVLALTAVHDGGGDRFEWIPVSHDGAIPGRPRTDLAGAGGPWSMALRSAQELGVTPARLDQVMADAPGRHLLVPLAWTEPSGWARFWARAHRMTRDVRARVPS